MSLVIPISAKSFPKLFETVPKVLIITKIIVPLTFHILCTSTLGSWYLSTFSCSLWKIFWAPGITVSIFKHFFFPFFIRIMSISFASIILFVLILKSHRGLHSSFFITFSSIQVAQKFFSCVWSPSNSWIIKIVTRNLAGSFMGP